MDSRNSAPDALEQPLQNHRTHKWIENEQLVLVCEGQNPSGSPINTTDNVTIIWCHRRISREEEEEEDRLRESFQNQSHICSQFNHQKSNNSSTTTSVAHEGTSAGCSSWQIMDDCLRFLALLVFRLEEDRLILCFLLHVSRKSLEELWSLSLANDLNYRRRDPSSWIHCNTNNNHIATTKDNRLTTNLQSNLKTSVTTTASVPRQLPNDSLLSNCSHVTLSFKFLSKLIR